MDKRLFCIKKLDAGMNRVFLSEEEKKCLRNMLSQVSDKSIDALYDYRTTYQHDASADFGGTVISMLEGDRSFTVSQYLWVVTLEVIFLMQHFYEEQGLSVLALHETMMEIRTYLREEVPFFGGAKDVSKATQTLEEYLMLERGAKERNDYSFKKNIARSKMLAFQPEIPGLLLQARQPYNRGRSFWEGEKPLLTLLHFSDVHNGKKNLQDIVELGSALPFLCNDILFTGDAVRTCHENGNTYWYEVPGAEKVLPCMGNHDLVNTPLMDWNDLIPMYQAAEEFFEPQKSLQDKSVTYKKGTTYYRKKYEAEGVLLITLDTFLKDEEEKAEFRFFEESLRVAKEEGLAVVIAQHDFPEDLVKIPCNFNTPFRKTQELCGPGLQKEFKEALQKFIDEGGEFTVFLCGHSHTPLLGYDKEYPRQLYIVLGASSTMYGTRGGDSLRVAGTQSVNLANFVTFDTEMHLIKLIRAGVTVNSLLTSTRVLTMNYQTKEIITQW